MGNLVVIGSQELRTLFGTYKQFINCFCNVFPMSGVRKSLWNGTLLLPRKCSVTQVHLLPQAVIRIK